MGSIRIQLLFHIINSSYIYEHYMYINTKVSFKQMIARILLFIYLWTVLESTSFTRVPQAHPQYELQVFWSWKAIFHYHDRELLKEKYIKLYVIDAVWMYDSSCSGKKNQLEKRAIDRHGYICGDRSITVDNLQGTI